MTDVTQEPRTEAGRDMLANHGYGRPVSAQWIARIEAEAIALPPVGGVYEDPDDVYRERRFSGPVVIVQTATDPGDMGEPREVTDDGVTYITVPPWEAWPVFLDSADALRSEARAAVLAEVRAAVADKVALICDCRGADCPRVAAVLALIDHISEGK